MVNYSDKIKDYASGIMEDIGAGTAALGIILGVGIVAMAAGLSRALQNYRRDAK